MLIIGNNAEDKYKAEPKESRASGKNAQSSEKQVRAKKTNK